MKVLEVSSGTHHRHIVRIEIRGTKWMETREKMPFEPQVIEVTWERKNDLPAALTKVSISGPPYGKKGKMTRPVALEYRAAMIGENPDRWATKSGWQQRFARLPMWTQWLVEQSWPSDF